jgi:hypothetical protein
MANQRSIERRVFGDLPALGVRAVAHGLGE